MRHRPRLRPSPLTLAAAALLFGHAASADEPRIYDTPPTRSVSHLAATDEPGTRMTLRGVVESASGKRIGGVIVVAYQTDAQGWYNPPNRPASSLTGTEADRVPRLRGAVLTDAKGEFTMHTIRPGGYPDPIAGVLEPAHIHFTATGDAIAKKHHTIWFEDDPRLTPERRGWAERDEETVIVPIDTRDGAQNVLVRIVVAER